MTAIDPAHLLESCFAVPPADARWTQFDIGLVRTAGDARPSARRLFALVMPWCIEQAAAGHLAHCFFMRKPPDVRLRFLARPQAQPALAQLAAALARELELGVLASAADGVYMPEETRFGGADALECVHAWFTLDTRLWWHNDRLALDGLQELSAEHWLAAVFQDLFEAVGVSDGWQRLAGHVLLAPDAPLAAPCRVHSLAELATDTARAEHTRVIAAAYRQGNARLAARLSLLTLPNACPAAEVAALCAFFTFNRHGFPGERSRPLVASVLAAQNSR